MTTEAKIREAYEQVCHDAAMPERTHGYIMFRAGYLALLNQLKMGGWTENKRHILYRLPEGVSNQ